MDAARWKQIQSILAQLFDAPRDRQELLLGRLCAGDAALREEVRELWLADQRDGGGRTRDGIEAVAREVAQQAILSPGERLGPFRIVHEIGRGGMGVVYLAEREAPFQQLVAIKVISPDRLGPHFASAFARERQILASLEHPSIARVFDGGETAAGIPYLVMEYVEGRPLGEEGAALGDRQANRLLVDRLLSVCDAVAYAQERLVVHGDLKPDNILVTREERVKLLDFGVAAFAAESSAFFSPGYASPEQQRGERLTPASDVFSLGRILGGQFRNPDQEMQAILRAAAAPDASLRYANAKELGSDLRRWRERRAVSAYSSGTFYHVWAWSRRNSLAATALLLALLSLVGGLAISMRQTNLTQAARSRAESEARRAEAASRVAEGATARAGAALREAEAARKSAEASAADARMRYAEVFQLSTAVLADFYEPARAPDFPTAARKWMVEKAQARLAALTRENPADVKVREALADAHSKIGDLLGNPSNANLGDVPGAAAAYQRADDILASLPSPQAKLRRIQLKIRRADLLTLTGEAALASRLYEQAAQSWKRLPASRGADAETGRILAVTLMKSAQGLILEGKFAPARPKLDESLAIIAPLAAAAPGNSRMQRTWISALTRLAYLERQLNRMPQARGYLAESAAVAERALRILPDDSDLRQSATMIYSQLGLADDDLKNHAQARDAFTRGLRLSGDDLQRDPRNAQIRATWTSLATNYSQLLWNLDQREEALALLRRAVEMRRESASADGAAQLVKLEAATLRMTLALRLMELGDVDEALREARLSIQPFSQLTERGDFRVGLQHGVSLFDLSLILDRAGAVAEARAAREQARLLLAPLAASQPKAAAAILRIDEKTVSRNLAGKP